jgi:hypothetical protein
MKTKDIITLSKYLSFCILLLITCSQIAAHTFSDNTLYNSIQLLKESKPVQQNGLTVIGASHGSGHMHIKAKIDIAENEVQEEEESISSRKGVDARLQLWKKGHYIFFKIFGDYIQKSPSFHLFSKTSDCWYLILQVFRI